MAFRLRWDTTMAESITHKAKRVAQRKYSFWVRSEHRGPQSFSQPSATWPLSPPSWSRLESPLLFPYGYFLSEKRSCQKHLNGWWLARHTRVCVNCTGCLSRYMEGGVLRCHRCSVPPRGRWPPGRLLSDYIMISHAAGNEEAWMRLIKRGGTFL